MKGEEKIPNDWIEYKLEDVLAYERPDAYIVKSTQYSNDYETPVLTAGKSFVIGKTNESEGIFFKIPVIIFDDFTTSSQYVNFPFKVKSSAMKILKIKDNKAIPKLIYYRMQIINFDASTHKRYWIQKYSKIKICIPEKIEDQENLLSRIEELLSELDAGIKALEVTKEKLEIYRQAVLCDAFKNLSNFQIITDFFDVTGGLTKNSKRESMPIKMKYLRVANVYYNRLNLSEVKEIGVKESEINEKLLKVNDLLFVEGNGSKDQIGRVAIWDGSIENCLHQNHIIKGRPLGNVESKYALYYLISSYGRKQIAKLAASTTGLYTLSTDKVRNLKIPYCDIEKQNQIVSEIESRLSVCDEIEKTVNQTLKQAEMMRQSILKKAFEGGL